MTAGYSEVVEARGRIAQAIEVHGSSRFQRWGGSGSENATVPNRLGFVKVEGDPRTDDNKGTFYFTAGSLKEVLAGLDFRTVVSELMAAGVIVPQIEKGKEVPSKVFHVRGGNGMFRLYQIDRDKLDGAPDDDATPNKPDCLAGVYRLPCGRYVARDTVTAAYSNLDLTGHRISDREKFAFAIDAFNRWTEFVESVRRVDALIRLYESGPDLPQLGGDPHE